MKTEKKPSADELAFENLLKKNPDLKTASRSSGKARMFKVYMAGVRRGKATK